MDPNSIRLCPYEKENFDTDRDPYIEREDAEEAKGENHRKTEEETEIMLPVNQWPGAARS